MKRYLNITRKGFTVATRPTKHSLGAADIPKLNLKYNQRIALIDHFIGIGLLFWGHDYDFCGNETPDQKLYLTDAGFRIAFGKH